jgi:hypothetical protein
VPLKSPTFLKRYLYRIYKLAMGPGATSADLDEIRKELETMVSAETLLAADASPPGPLDQRSSTKPDEDEGDGDEDADPAKDSKPPPRPAPVRGRRLFPVT